MKTIIDETVETMKRGIAEIQRGMRVEAELREQIATQRAIMAVALGYIRANQIDLAAMALGGKLPTKQEVAP